MKGEPPRLWTRSGAGLCSPPPSLPLRKPNDGTETLQTANNRQGHDNQLKRVSTFQRAGGGGRRDELLPFRTGISAIREGGQHDLVAVRQSIRRPVSCLWQAEEQRASTAPARVSSWTTADAETSNHNAVTLRTDSDRRGTGSHSQALRTTTEAFSEAAAGTSRGTISAPGKGGGGREGYGGGNGLSHRWVAGELKTYAGDRAEEALEYRPPSDVGMMGRTFVDPKATGPPLRSSHRVGPVGAMAFDLESRPRPASRSGKPIAGEATEEERRKTFTQAVKERKTIVIVEPPLNYKMVFDGPTNIINPKQSADTISMALFPHAPGASVCASLYEHYVAEDGLCYHLYHTGRVVCEVLDPGEYPMLCAPTELEHVLRRNLPDPPPPAYPSGKKDAKPVLYLPPQRECPQLSAHYVPLCKAACRQAHHGGECPGARCTMLGAMPADFLVFEVGEEPPAAESVDNDEDDTAGSKNVWDVNKSIFAPRRKEAESRSLFDKDRTVKKAFDADYGRMLKEGRVFRLIAKADAAVGRGEKTVEDSLNEVKAAIAPFYRAILRIFNFYCLTSAQSIRGAFSIQPNQFGKMMQDAELAGNSISVEEIGKIFVMVNFETDKGSAEADVNEDRALMRFELIEALLRVAITMRDNEGKGEIAPADKLRAMIGDQFLANLPPEATEESDNFREQTLYTEECDRVFQDHQKALAMAYLKYSLLDPVAGKPSFGLEEWKVFLSDTRLIGDNGYVLKVGLRESKMPFYRARMMVSDEIKNRTKMVQLTFVDFLETLARLTNVVPLPPEADMERLTVTDVLDYEMAKNNNGETLQLHQDGMKAATSGAFAPRLDQLIRYIIGTLAIRFNGSLKAGNNKGALNLVGTYCTKQQLERAVDA